jgi:hypothetical protein
MKFTRQVIGVAVNPRDPNERVQVPALVLGDLAIHGVLGGEDGYTPQNCYYVVTHVPSGYKLAEAYKQRSCRRLVEQLHTLGLNWKFDAHSMTEEVYEIAIPIIRAFNSDTNN